MQTEYAFDVDNAILRQIGSDFCNTRKANWKNTAQSWDEFYHSFEDNLDADYAIDYVGVKVYFKNNEPVAWADDEQKCGFKEA